MYGPTAQFQGNGVGGGVGAHIPMRRKPAPENPSSSRSQLLSPSPSPSHCGPGAGTVYGVAKGAYVVPVRVMDCQGSGLNSAGGAAAELRPHIDPPPPPGPVRLWEGGGAIF